MYKENFRWMFKPDGQIHSHSQSICVVTGPYAPINVKPEGKKGWGGGSWAAHVKLTVTCIPRVGNLIT